MKLNQDVWIDTVESVDIEFDLTDIIDQLTDEDVREILSRRSEPQIARHLDELEPWRIDDINMHLTSHKIVPA